jgi:hypothetical protein
MRLLCRFVAPTSPSFLRALHLRHRVATWEIISGL